MATVPEHMQDATSPVVQVVAGLIFAVFLSALTWGLVNYF